MARTLVTNIAGEARYYGFLPPHGAQMADGQALTIDGDLRTILAGGLNRFTRRAELAALDAAVDAGLVTVEETADPSSSSSSGP